MLPIKVTVNSKTLKLLKIAFVLCYKNQIFPYFHAKCLCSLSLQEGLTQTSFMRHNFFEKQRGRTLVLKCLCHVRDNLFSLLQLQNVKENFYRSKTDVLSVKNSSVLSISFSCCLYYIVLSLKKIDAFPLPLLEVLICIISFVKHIFSKN